MTCRKHVWGRFPFSFFIHERFPLKVLGGIIRETPWSSLYIKSLIYTVDIKISYSLFISVSSSWSRKPPAEKASICVLIWAWMLSLTFKVLFQILPANEWKCFHLAWFPRMLEETSRLAMIVSKMSKDPSPRVHRHIANTVLPAQHHCLLL